MTAGQGARDSGGRSASNRIQASSEGRPEASGTISSSSGLNSVVPVSSQCGSLHRVVAELRPQPLHKRANQSPVRAAVPNSSAQRVVGHHATGVERKRERQFELPRGQFHVFTIHRDPAAGLIDRQRAQLDRRSGRRTWVRRPAPAPGHCGSGSGWPPGPPAQTSGRNWRSGSSSVRTPASLPHTRESPPTATLQIRPIPA